MRELVLHFHLTNLRRIGSKDMIGYIDDEVHYDRLLMSLFPVFVDLFLILLEFVHSTAEEQAGDVVIIVGRGKGLDGRQVLLDSLELLLGGCSLMLIDGR